MEAQPNLLLTCRAKLCIFDVYFCGVATVLQWKLLDVLGLCSRLCKHTRLDALLEAANLLHTMLRSLFIYRCQLGDASTSIPRCSAEFWLDW
jgi:hypothetical protein